MSIFLLNIVIIIGIWAILNNWVLIDDNDYNIRQNLKPIGFKSVYFLVIDIGEKEAKNIRCFQDIDRMHNRRRLR